MTYQICYSPSGEKNRCYILFDIEYYLKKWNSPEGWYSEIDCLPVVEGISYFIKEHLNDKDFNFDEFIEDATYIQEIRGLLPKIFGDGSKQKTSIYIFLHREFEKRLEEMLCYFCDKYNLYISTGINERYLK